MSRSAEDCCVQVREMQPQRWSSQLCDLSKSKDAVEPHPAQQNTCLRGTISVSTSVFLCIQAEGQLLYELL